MKIEGARVLVTGGAGFIGSHLVEDLVRRGARVRVYDHFSSGSRENLAAVAGDVEVLEGDVLDAARLRRACRGMDVVSHQAAQLEITACVKDPIADLHSNTIGTLNVLEAARKAGVGLVVNASSACVYGQPERTPTREDRDPTNPNWAYGVSKLAAEKYGQIYHHHHGLPVVSLRYAIVYGPREWFGRVLTLFLKACARGRNPVVFGEGAQRRDFTSVHDLVRLHALCLSEEAAWGEVFNVSTGRGTTIAALAEKVCAWTGAGVEPVFEDVEVGGRSRLAEGKRQRLPSELEAMVLSPAKARRVLGWKPEVGLKAGVEEQWRWLQEGGLARWKKMSY